MSFEVIKVYSIFQHLMNNVFRKFLDKFDVYYLDSILIYFKNIEEHIEHMKYVLQKLLNV